MTLYRFLKRILCWSIFVLLTLYLCLSSWSEKKAPYFHGVDSKTQKNLASTAVDDTLVVVSVSSDNLIWVDNLLCSLVQTTFDPTKILFWALETKVKDVLDARGYTTYHDPGLYPASRGVDAATDHRTMMTERPKFFMDLLSTGYDILLVDAETIFFDSPISLRDPHVDMTVSSGSREFYTTPGRSPFGDNWHATKLIPPVSNGIFWMKSTPHTMKLWQDMLDIFEAGPRSALYRSMIFPDERSGLNVLLNDGRATLVEPLPMGITPDLLIGRMKSSARIKVRMLDQASVVNGDLLKHRREQYEQNLAELELQGGRKTAFLFNWDMKKGASDRLEEVKSMGLWQLLDDGKCMHDWR